MRFSIVSPVRSICVGPFLEGRDVRPEDGPADATGRGGAHASSASGYPNDDGRLALVGDRFGLTGVVRGAGAGPRRLEADSPEALDRVARPSITLKWMRTVSPALNCGRPSRSWARSRLSITLLIGRRAPKGRRQMLANVNPLGAALDLG